MKIISIDGQSAYDESLEMLNVWLGTSPESSAGYDHFSLEELGLQAGLSYTFQAEVRNLNADDRSASITFNVGNGSAIAVQTVIATIEWVSLSIPGVSIDVGATEIYFPVGTYSFDHVELRNIHLAN